MNQKNRQKIKRNAWGKLWLSLCICACTLSLAAQQNAVTGVVADVGGDPLSGVNVVIRGTNTGVAIRDVSQCDVTL
jgi:hypothetical protein